MEYSITIKPPKTYEIKYNPDTFGRKMNKILRQNGITSEQYIELLNIWSEYRYKGSEDRKIYYPSPLELYRIKILENIFIHVRTAEGFFHGHILQVSFTTEGTKQGVKFGLYTPCITEDSQKRTTAHNKPILKYNE